MKLPKILILPFLCICNNMLAQDISFSNYKQASLLYNPAMLAENQRTQATLNFRNMELVKDIHYYSSYFLIQTPLNYQYKRINPGNIGISVYDDRMSNTGYINTTGISIAYAQPIRTSSNSTLTLGLQYSFFQRKFDMSGYSTGNQWNTQLGYINSLPLGEDVVNENIRNYTINAGILWRSTDIYGDSKSYFGISVFNLNRPDESFSNLKHKTNFRYSALAGYKIFDNGNFRLTPELLCTLNDNLFFINSGLKLGLNTSGSNPHLPFSKGLFNISTKYLSNESIMVGASLEQPFYEFGISYDYSVSNIMPGISNALELFLVIKIGRTKSKTEKPVAQDYRIGEVRDFFDTHKRDTVFITIPSKTHKKEHQDANRKPVSLALKRDFKFGFNDATLNDESKAYLDEMVVLLEKNELMSLEIVGHTDDVGTEEGNRIISLKRAQIVADYFISKGIAKERITVTGKQNKEPLFPNTSPENRSRNRRVEFFLTE